ncbi:MAG: hypothetical protein IAB16_06060 [Firmicutes bacterium]|uniref:Uncharacterized protein n=1 Tax=Candidatus Stercoripulliclostridium pullicola TaxID=2840953 RepID=A0A940DHL3_9FIRM|nr:hypothetical protein [Candidatus Stercoripulliclostridium pullicola]
MEKERKMKTTTIITAIIAIFLAVVAPIAYLRSNENANATLDETVTNAGGEVTGKDETLLPSDDDADSADNAADAGNGDHDNENAEMGENNDSSANADDDKDVLVLSLADGLNVRSGRGTSYASLGTLDKGDMVAYVSMRTAGTRPSIRSARRIYPRTKIIPRFTIWTKSPNARKASSR